MTVAILQRLCGALKFAPVYCTYCASDSFWFLKAANILQCADFLLQSAMNITAQFADMIPYLATTMQSADVSLALLQILPDGKVPCNELMLHHAMQCTGASCRMLQIPSNFAEDSTQLRDSNSKRPTYGTPIHTQRCFDKDMFSHMDLHIPVLLPRDGFTRKYLHARVFLHRDTFIQKTFAHRRVGTCTHTCLYTAMLLQRSAFTRTCVSTGLLLTQLSFYTQKILG